MSTDNIWETSSAAFTLSIAVGVISAPQRALYGEPILQFSADKRTLLQIGCVDFPVERGVELGASAVDRIVAELRRMQTACSAPCQPDVPSASLVVRDGGTCVRHVYDSNVASCGQTNLPPHVASDDVARLRGLLDSTLTEICTHREIDGRWLVKWGRRRQSRVCRRDRPGRGCRR